MPADVNVTEKVARALHKSLAPVWMSVARALGGDQAQYESMLDDLATAALSALADPEVQAGIAGVIDEHGPAVAFYDAGRLLGCRGTDCAAWRPPSEGDGDPWRAHAEHVSAAVVEWLRGAGAVTRRWKVHKPGGWGAWFVRDGRCPLPARPCGGCTSRWFDTWREAFDYAARMARGKR